MIVATNSFIPAFKKYKLGASKKNRQLLATTTAGDEAFYISGLSAKEAKEDDEDDDDDMSDIEDEIDVGGELYSKPVRSLSGAPWSPNFIDRMTMFIAGTPGAGKSYLAKQMINLLPHNLEILLFTALEESDGNFDDLGKERLFKIRMKPEILSKITLKEIRERTKGKQTILLFDDVDKIREPKIQNLVFALMNDALANGRGHVKHDGSGDIHVICTSHSANDYQKTKYTFENSNYVALFPGTTPPLQMLRMFDKLGLDKDLCAKMIRLARQQKIRSIIIHKVVPMYMIFGDKIMLL